MNDNITIQEVTESRSSTGAVTESWATWRTMWVDVEQVSGSENFDADMVVYNDVKKFEAHYIDANGVTAKMRILYGSEIYHITSISHKKRLKTTIIAARQDDE